MQQTKATKHGSSMVNLGKRKAIIEKSIYYPTNKIRNGTSSSISASEKSMKEKMDAGKSIHGRCVSHENLAFPLSRCRDSTLESPKDTDMAALELAFETRGKIAPRTWALFDKLKKTTAERVAADKENMKEHPALPRLSLAPRMTTICIDDTRYVSLPYYPFTPEIAEPLLSRTANRSFRPATHNDGAGLGPGWLLVLPHELADKKKNLFAKKAVSSVSSVSIPFLFPSSSTTTRTIRVALRPRKMAEPLYGSDTFETPALWSSVAMETPPRLVHKSSEGLVARPLILSRANSQDGALLQQALSDDETEFTTPPPCVRKTKASSNIHVPQDQEEDCSLMPPPLLARTSSAATTQFNFDWGDLETDQDDHTNWCHLHSELLALPQIE
jgi:hypothetical protein